MTASGTTPEAPTSSLGVVDTQMPNVGLQRLIREAERALYEAKAAGRNRAMVGRTLAGTEPPP